MNRFDLTYKPFGMSSILVEWPQIVSKEILLDMRSFSKMIEQETADGIVDISYVYASMLISFKSELFSYESFKLLLTSIYKLNTKPGLNDLRSWEIPVCYDEEFGIDLITMSEKLRISIDEIIEIHTGTVYQVYGLGFLPGFLYLGGLKEKIHFPRRAVPRRQVVKGAVGIAGQQTGIYPKSSPGGWNIIGNTPLHVFDIQNNPPCVFSPGDRVNFIRISRKNYDHIKQLQEQGEGTIKTIEND